MNSRQVRQDEKQFIKDITDGMRSAQLILSISPVEIYRAMTHSDARAIDPKGSFGILMRRCSQADQLPAVLACRWQLRVEVS